MFLQACAEGHLTERAQLPYVEPCTMGLRARRHCLIRRVFAAGDSNGELKPDGLGGPSYGMFTTLIDVESL